MQHDALRTDEPLDPSTPLMKSSKVNEPILYWQRWMILTLFSLVSLTNAMNWVTYSPIATKTQTFYNQNSVAVDAFSLCYMIVYIPFIFVSSWLFKRFGLRVGMIVSAILNTGGAWIRYAGTAPEAPIYGVALFGQIICSAAQTFILQVPPLIANDWFGKSERTLATSIGADFNQLGVAVGFLMGAFMVQEVADIRLLILVQAIVTTVPSVLAIIGIRDRPPTPPSFAAQRKTEAANGEKVHEPTFWEICKKLLHNADYIILFLCFGLIIGCFYAIATVLTQILEAFVYTSYDGGFLGFILTVVGIAGAIAIGLLCDKTHRYKELLFLINAGNAACFLWLAFIVAPNNYPHLAVNQSVLGLFITGSLPAYLEASAEITYPDVPEDFSAGIMIMGAQIFGIVLTFSMNAMIRAKLFKECIWLCVAVCCATVALLFFVRPKYKRFDAEQAEAARIAANEHTRGAIQDQHHIVPLDDNPHLEPEEKPRRIIYATSTHHKHAHHSASPPKNATQSVPTEQHTHRHHKHHHSHSTSPPKNETSVSSGGHAHHHKKHTHKHVRHQDEPEEDHHSHHKVSHHGEHHHRSPPRDAITQ